jgi:hypothetical protein
MKKIYIILLLLALIKMNNYSSAQTINAIAIAPSNIYPGDSFIVFYNATGTWSWLNVFTAELSDSNGHFVSPTTLGALASTTSGAIHCYIPVNCPVGCDYSIRVEAASLHKISDTLTHVCIFMNDGIASVINQSSFRIFPNLSSNTIFIHSQLPNPLFQISIADIMGNKIYQQYLTGTENSIDVTSWSEGIYFYEIKSNEGNARGKFVVKK